MKIFTRGICDCAHAAQTRYAQITCAEMRSIMKGLSRLQKRMLLQIVAGFLLGRISMFGYHPLGAAFFLSGFGLGGATLGVALAVLGGMLWSATAEELIRYTLGMLIVWAGADLLKRCHVKAGTGHYGLLMTAGMLGMTAVQSIWESMGYQLWLGALCECLLILAFSRLYQEGVTLLLYGHQGEGLNQEQLVSTLLLGLTSLYGLPSMVVSGVSFLQVLAYLILLFVGYIYGVGAGAIAGVGVGLLLVAAGQSLEQMGILCLVGICVGMMGTRGRPWTVMSFLLAYLALCYISRDVVLEWKAWREVALSAAVFLLWPSRYLVPWKKILREQEEGGACQDLRNLMEYRIMEVADAFARVAGSMEDCETEGMARMEGEDPMQCNERRMNRQILSDQMRQVSEVLRQLAENMEHIRQIPWKKERELRNRLEAMRIRVGGVHMYADADGRVELHLKARTDHGKLVLTREAGQEVSRILGKTFGAARECRHVIPREECTLIFREMAPMTAQTGVARIPKEGEELSGDVFSCMRLPRGELMLALSDGMGSGMPAFQESRRLMELLEVMTEAGFSRENAFRVINGMYMTREEAAASATADVTVLNLYRGTCQFLKSGAVSTWIRHGASMEKIKGEALPVGVDCLEEPFRGKSRISPGDYVIMVTDGVVDALQGREGALEEVLEACQDCKPQEMAEEILEQALLECQGTAPDDMSVIVAGIEAA